VQILRTASCQGPSRRPRRNEQRDDPIYTPFPRARAIHNTHHHADFSAVLVCETGLSARTYFADRLLTTTD
jgi:hypothetical protein